MIVHVKISKWQFPDVKFYALLKKGTRRKVPYAEVSTSWQREAHSFSPVTWNDFSCESTITCVSDSSQMWSPMFFKIKKLQEEKFHLLRYQLVVLSFTIIILIYKFLLCFLFLWKKLNYYETKYFLVLNIYFYYVIDVLRKNVKWI